MLLLVVPVCLVAIYMSFSSFVWGWGLLLVAVSILFVVYAAAKKTEWKDIPELSPWGNEMFKQYGHFYTAPHAAQMTNSFIVVTQLSGFAIGIVNAFHSEWLGLVLGVVVFLALIPIAKYFNPMRFIQSSVAIAAHNEVVEYMTKLK